MTAAADSFAPNLATTLINEFGVAATLTEVGRPEFDQIKGESIDRQVTATSVTLTPPIRYRQQFRLIVNDVSLQSSSITYMKGSDNILPKRGMKITLSGRDWKVLQVDPLVSGNETAAYRLWIDA